MDVAAETRPWPRYPRKSVWRPRGRLRGGPRLLTGDTGGSGGQEEERRLGGKWSGEAGAASHALPGEDPRLLASSLSTEAAIEAQLLGQRAAPCKRQRPEGAGVG